MGFFYFGIHVKREGVEVLKGLICFARWYVVGEILRMGKMCHWRRYNHCSTPRDLFCRYCTIFNPNVRKLYTNPPLLTINPRVYQL